MQSNIRPAEALRRQLRSIDHRGYPAYKDLKGSWNWGKYILNIDHVQGDPFASPSLLSINVRGDISAFPAEYYSTRTRRIAVEDHLIRLFSKAVGRYSFKAGGSGKSGYLGTSRPGQEVLERSACHIDSRDGSMIIRFEAGFPAAGRSVLAGNLERILFDFIPDCVETSLIYENIDADKLRKAVFLADDQEYLRKFIEEKDCCAFIADGSVLPRESGISEKPLRGAVKFRSPSSMSISAELPHAGKITGMAVRRGITVIAGGGYHGKSTLLGAIQRGVYDHVSGDGREYVVTDRSAVKLRAEDGRSISGTDISMFIGDLPGGEDTRHFSTENASGSTSQAANLAEAAEAGSKLLLIDEDTSATNFMVRDALMLSVISPDMEPITPLLERAQLLKENGISMILAVGSSGTWFYPADRIIQMDRWLPYDITEKAKDAAERFGAELPEQGDITFSVPDRVPCVPKKYDHPDSKENVGNRNNGNRGHGRRRDDRIKTRVSGCEAFSLDHNEVDLRSVEQIADREQTAALAACAVYAIKNLMDGHRSLSQIADELLDIIDNKGLSAVSDGTPSCGLARPRRQEIMAAINRWRGLKVKTQP